MRVENVIHTRPPLAHFDVTDMEKRAPLLGAKVIPIHSQLAECHQAVEIIHFHTPGYYTVNLHLLSDFFGGSLDSLSLELRSPLYSMMESTFIQLPFMVNLTGPLKNPTLKTTWNGYYMYGGMTLHLVRSSNGPSCVAHRITGLPLRVEGYVWVKQISPLQMMMHSKMKRK